MPGSVGNPVRFAFPFRRITEVGWPANWIVVSIQMGGDVVSDNVGAVACTPFVSATSPMDSNYMSEWNLEFSNPGVQLVKASGSENITSESTVNGTPTPASFTYGAFEKVSGSQVLSGYGSTGVKGRFQLQSGPKVEVPNIPSIDDVFFESLSCTAEGFGDTFTGGSQCSDPTSQGPDLWTTAFFCTGYEVGVGNPHDNASVYSDQVLDFSGMTVEYEDDTYEAVGLKVTSSVGTPNPDVGTIQILFQKQEG